MKTITELSLDDLALVSGGYGGDGDSGGPGADAYSEGPGAFSSGPGDSDDGGASDPWGTQDDIPIAEVPAPNIDPNMPQGWGGWPATGGAV